MENHASFDLERAVTAFLDDLGARPGCAPGDLRELEDHLRESVGALLGRGLTAEEAFLLARRRLGDAAALDAEFSKVHQRRVWGDRALWMLVGVQAWTLFWDVGGLARMAAAWMLTRVYSLPSGAWTTDGGWYATLWPPMSLAIAELAIAAVAVVWLAWWTRRRRIALAARVGSALGRPAPSALLALGLLGVGLAVKAALLAGNMTLIHMVPMAQHRALSAYSSMATSLLTLGQTLAVPVLLVAAARRRRLG